jgi:hypothetical protein
VRLAAKEQVAPDSLKQRPHWQGANWQKRDSMGDPASVIVSHR